MQNAISMSTPTFLFCFNLQQFIAKTKCGMHFLRAEFPSHLSTLCVRVVLLYLPLNKLFKNTAVADGPSPDLK